MIRRLFLTLAVPILVAVSVPNAKADTFSLNHDFSGKAPGTGPWGTVTVTDNGSGVVTISVTLNSPEAFHDEGQASFSFNGPSGLASSQFSVTDDGGSMWTFPGSSNSDGAGTFLYTYECSSGSNHCGGAPTTFTFTITTASTATHTLVASDFENNNGNKSNSYFAANVANQDTNSCTGQVGGGGTTANSGATTGSCSTPTPTVPEPTSILLLGTVLALTGKFILRNLSA